MARWYGSSTERALGGKHAADAKRLKAVMREGTPCWRCGEPMYSWQDLDRDHVIDRVHGGGNGPAVLAHANCNRSRGATMGNQLRGFTPAVARAGQSVTCKACGRPYHYAARSCEMCGTHYHPSYGQQRTCGRACGRELQRRNRGNRPVGDRVRTASITVTTPAPWRSSREWLTPAGRTYGKPVASPIYLAVCEHCGEWFTRRTKAGRFCSRRCSDASYNAKRPRPTERICPCGAMIQPPRLKCDDCILPTTNHKTECRHEGCSQGANRAGRLCSRHYRDALPRGGVNYAA